MRIVKGYQLKVQNISYLTQEECDQLIMKMGTFAIALRRVFDDPILLQEDSITTHYSSKDYANVTVAHVQHYLCTIKMEGKVRVTLVEMKLSLGWDDAWLQK